MTLLDSPVLAGARRTGSTPGRLIMAEVMKIRTTNTWWLFIGGVLVFTSFALTRNGARHDFDLNPNLDGLNPSDKAQALAQAAQAHTHASLDAIAGDMMTSGQFIGVLFAMIIGILVVTNEFAHQTATATFMANPRRTRVIMAKFVAAAGFGALFWLASTLLDVIVTPIYLRSEYVSVALTDWVVVRAVLLNLLAFVMWAIFGLGLGTLVRSQIGSVITGMAAYLLGIAVVAAIVQLIYTVYHHAWVQTAIVIAPAVASLVMTTPGRIDTDSPPPQWAGIVVMLGYTMAFGAIGIILTRRRDVS
jgi:ABC-type transport system involved in multi-copper enzyme maturation permease subunit